MKGTSRIIELGLRFDIETLHTGHVARLSLDMFDGFFPLKGLSKGDRRILFAAACLHDIAYASDPVNHVVEGARILAENPIDDFTADEWQAVIGITLLHKRDWRAMLQHELFPKSGKKKLDRIKKLAAIMRIADGLDHGHIQDTRIFYCKRGKKVDKVGVECDWYQGNIPWAEMKADLWEAVFRRPFRLEGKMVPRKKMFKGVVHKDDGLFTAVRRILYSQWSIMRDQIPDMLDDPKPECLFTYYSALNRFRTALTLFTPVLKETCAADLNNQLDSVSDRLVPVIALNTKLRLLKEMESSDARLQGIKMELDARVAEANLTLKKMLESESCLQAVQIAARMLRIELPRLERGEKEPLFVDFAMEALNDCLDRITAVNLPDMRDVGAAQLETMQNVVSQGLYCSEFCAPATGKNAQRAAKRLKTMAAALDELRYVGLLNDEIGHTDRPKEIEQLESEAWERLEKSWCQFAES